MTQTALPIHVLVVAPRPVGQDPSSATSRCEALYDALDAQGDQVVAEWLRPATAEALVQRLQDEGGQPIQVLYLDTPLWLDSDGLAVRLETADGAEQSLAWAALQDALGERETLLILGAGASAEAQSSLSSTAHPTRCDLIALPDGWRGEQARQAFLALFASLLAGQSLAQAVAEARADAVVDPVAAWLAGQGPGTESAQAAAWLLAREPEAPWLTVDPAKAAGAGKVVQFPSPGLSPAWRRLAAEPSAAALPPEPPHGFVGRAEALAALERLLAKDADESVVWICGYEGIGKTSLMAHLARWLVRTGRFARVAYTTFAGGCLPEVALHDLGVCLLGEGFSLAQPDALAAIEDALDETPTLILWDDIESILPGGEHPLPAAQLAGLRDLASRLTAEAGRLCLIANAPGLPTQARDAAPTDRVYTVLPMSVDEASALVGATAMRLHRRLPTLSGVEAMVARLGGHPLALCALASLLAEQSADELLATLRQALPGLDDGEARLRNQALYIALDRVLQEAPAEARERLPGLGLLDAGFMEMLGRQIVGLDEGLWQAGMERLSAAQLLRTTPLPGLTVSYVHLHPALARHLGRKLTAAVRAEAEARLSGEYRRLLAWLPQLAARSGQVAEILFRCELSNLRQVVTVLLAGQELEAAMSHAQQVLPFLRRPGWRDTWNLMNAHIERAAQAIAPAEGPLGRAGVRFLLSQSEQLSVAGRVAESGTLLQQLTQRMSQENGLSYQGDEANLDRGVAMHRLGRLMQTAGRPDMALGVLQMAAELLGDVHLAEAQRALVSTLGDQSALLLAVGQGEKAEQASQAALQLATTLQETSVMGVLHAQLGAVAMARNDAVGAREQLLAAIELLAQNPEDSAVASLWSQLGALAWDTSHDAAEAERCLTQASTWAERTGQTPLRVQVEAQLADIEEATGRLPEAEARLLQTAEMCEARDYIPGQLSAEIALSEYYLRRHNLPQAKLHAEQARLVADNQPQGFPWQVYGLLRQIAEIEGVSDQERHWRRQEQEVFIASPESQLVRQQWAQLIEAVARACRGQAMDVETAERVEKLEAQPEWREMAQAIWRILGGERGEALYAALDHLDATVIHAIVERAEAPEDESAS